MSHTLIVLPDDTAAPILSAIHGAQEALNIRMFLFTDTSLIEAVIAAHQRGVKVRVMLNPARRSGESENEEARELLTGAGIEVRDSNPAFDLTHQKSMVVDNSTGFVESLNWEPKDLTLTRDYAIVTTRGHEAAAMVDCFDADWDHQEFTPPPASPLIWPKQRPPACRRVYRLDQAHPMAAKRALPRSGDYRAFGACDNPWSEGAYPGQASAFA